MIAAEPVQPAAPVCFEPEVDALPGHRHVTVGIDVPARGLTIAINLRPDKRCNFECVYCPVDRRPALAPARLDVDRMAAELRVALVEVREGPLRLTPRFRNLPPELLTLRHVTLEGDGEPTLAPEFLAAVEAVVHVRAQRGGSFFPLVLRTNGSRLDVGLVQAAMEYFTRADEVWIKLDAGTQEWMNRVNRPDCTLERVLSNIALVSRRQRVVIETVFCSIAGQTPPPSEIGAYIERLRDLRAAGSQIASVRLHSAGERCGNSVCGQIPLRQLAGIARQIRTATGLDAEVY